MEGVRTDLPRVDEEEGLGGVSLERDRTGRAQ